mmetsp:Transcript_14641/g.31900  ORF Transcript_14641/g.31900 Transcript_14641/m.31900 type:complete len:105 (-) Transcript_14641:1180-1494(-)
MVQHALMATCLGLMISAAAAADPKQTFRYLLKHARLIPSTLQLTDRQALEAAEACAQQTLFTHTFHTLTAHNIIWPQGRTASCECSYFLPIQTREMLVKCKHPR